MSARNGDKARFQKDRKRKVRYRQRLRALMAARAVARAASPEMPIKGGPASIGD